MEQKQMLKQRFFNVVLVVLALLLLTAVVIELAPGAHAAPAQAVTSDVGVCDPWYPQNCAAPVGRISAGTGQFGVTISSATAPTIPSGTLGVLVLPVGTNNTSGQCLMWRDDGTAPTGTVGNPAPANVPIWYYVKTSATLSAPNANFQVIAATGATCAANFIYYK